VRGGSSATAVTSKPAPGRAGAERFDSEENAFAPHRLRWLRPLYVLLHQDDIGTAIFRT
jgi:hypothetical protein